MEINWQDLSKITNVNYICGYCGKYVGPSEGYKSNSKKMVFISAQIVRNLLIVCKQT